MPRISHVFFFSYFSFFLSWYLDILCMDTLLEYFKQSAEKWQSVQHCLYVSRMECPVAYVQCRQRTL